MPAQQNSMSGCAINAPCDILTLTLIICAFRGETVFTLDVDTSTAKPAKDDAPIITSLS